MQITVTPTAPIDITGALPIDYALTPIGSALANVRYYLGDETDPATRAHVLAALERAEHAVVTGTVTTAADLLPQQRATSTAATVAQTDTVPDADTLPRLWQLDILDDADGIDPPFPVLEVDDTPDLNTPGRLREAAAQYRELADQLDTLADTTPTATCTRLPGCDGEMHPFGHCNVRMVDLATAGLVMQVDLNRNVPEPGLNDTPHLQVWLAESDEHGDPTLDQAATTVTSPADAHALADALVAFAAGLRRAGDTLGTVTR